MNKSLFRNNKKNVWLKREFTKYKLGAHGADFHWDLNNWKYWNIF